MDCHDSNGEKEIRSKCGDFVITVGWWGPGGSADPKIHGGRTKKQRWGEAEKEPGLRTLNRGLNLILISHPGDCAEDNPPPTWPRWFLLPTPDFHLHKVTSWEDRPIGKTICVCPKLEYTQLSFKWDTWWYTLWKFGRSPFPELDDRKICWKLYSKSHGPHWPSGPHPVPLGSFWTAPLVLSQLFAVMAPTRRLRHGTAPSRSGIGWSRHKAFATWNSTWG